MEEDDVHVIKKYAHRRICAESRKPRQRSACPKCDSVLVKKRRRTNDYVCSKCKWEGSSDKKVMW